MDFGPLLFPQELDNLVIDRVLNHIEGQFVLKALLADKKWKDALAGDSGGTHPARWSATARGIEILGNQPEMNRLIKPAQILARAKLYQPQIVKPF